MNEYTYYCTARPASPGAIPTEGIVKIENFEKRFQFAFCKAWGKVTYNRELLPDEISNYELSENKAPQDDFIKLLPVDVMKIFKGTDEEAEREERKAERNNRTLKNLYELVLDGSLNYCYFETAPAKETGIKSVFVLHPSAKYDTGLQFTCYHEKDGDFLYMVFDCHIEKFEDFKSEVNFNAERKIFYNAD